MGHFRSIDLAKLNSLTKYPSIPTYHTLDPSNGRLSEPPINFGTETVIGTEKVDGTSSRIIFGHDGSYLIGSREELLHHRDDLIANPSQGIVAATKEHAERMRTFPQLWAFDAEVTVYYLETYGGNIGKAAKQYSSCGKVSVRLFDVAIFRDMEELLKMEREQISGWREHNGQSFLNETRLETASIFADIPLTPRIFVGLATDLPQTLEGMSEFLAEHIPISQCCLDDECGRAPEGLVLRTPDRSIIAKARFEDYKRTLKGKRR
jgi:hypothetical protein